MNCESIQRLINKYFNEELPELEKEKVLQHISQCKDCKAKFNAEKTTVQLLNQTSIKKAPINFTINVMNQIEKQKDEQKLQITDHHIMSILGKSLIAAGIVFCLTDVSMLYEKFNTISLKFEGMNQIYNLFNLFK